MPQYAWHRICHSPCRGGQGRRALPAAAEVKVDNATSAEFFALSSRSARRKRADAATVVVAAAVAGVVRVAASKSKRWQYT